ncbi:DUF362 domain-containing protein [bacterium]|nr:DUF362 domain-containing protein [bacterium]
MTDKRVRPGSGGDKYVPYEERVGGESAVFFTKELSEEGLKRVFARIGSVLQGKIAVKLHTGEPYGPNIIPRPWVRALLEDCLPAARIVETNSYYDGDRYTTEKHRRTLETNGWNFAPVDILDENGFVYFPITGGKWFAEMAVGKNLADYDSLLALTHFKGHVKGGFGGSNKNLGIGCADGRVGKAMIHTTPNQSNQWDISNEEFMERMTESTKSVVDHFAGRIAYINVMRNMSVSCDCEGVYAAPVVTPDIGILASLDIAALDQACVDLIYALPDKAGGALRERIESRRALRQLTYMQVLGMGNLKYRLIDTDNNDREVSAAEAVKGIEPFWKPDRWN